MSEDCDFCRLGYPCGLHSPVDDRYRNRVGTLERERYEARRAKLAEKLRDFKSRCPGVGCCDGTIVGHYLKYSRRF